MAVEATHEGHYILGQILWADLNAQRHTLLLPVGVLPAWVVVAAGIRMRSDASSLQAALSLQNTAPAIAQSAIFH